MEVPALCCSQTQGCVEHPQGCAKGSRGHDLIWNLINRGIVWVSGAAWQFWGCSSSTCVKAEMLLWDPALDVRGAVWGKVVQKSTREGLERINQDLIAGSFNPEVNS